MSAACVPGVRSIAILRANAIGDFLFTLPALAALRRAYPHARLVWLGQAWHSGFCTGRGGLVDEVVALPPTPGVTAPAQAAATPAVAACVDELRARRFDLVLQMHGGGRHSNPFVSSLGARITAGAQASDAPALDRSMAYQPLQNERLRLLEIAALVGAVPAQLDPRLPLAPSDFAAIQRVLPRAPDSFAVLQPGARDPRRRWPVERFAAVGDALARMGLTIVINGTGDERSTTQGVIDRMSAAALDLTGALELGALAALLARARLVVSNDTGPLHLAHAVGAPCVGIYWLTNVLVSAPLRWGRQRAVVSMRADCPVCGAVNTAMRCEHDASFVGGVAVEEVMAAARDLLTSRAAVRAPRSAPHPPASLPDPTRSHGERDRAAPSA